MIHWCIEEQLTLMALLGMVPFVGPWFRGWLARRRSRSDCPCGHDGGEQH